MADLTPEERTLIDAVTPLARAALHASQREDWPTCKQLIEQISRELGADGIYMAALAWLDTMLDYAKPPGAKGMAVPAWRDADTGQHTKDAHQVRPSIAWCGQLAVARANDDQGTFEALFEAIPEGQEGAYVAELLMIAGMTINAALRGGRRG
ncbi:hypothetical protein [Sphaerimonospora thailandensis]|uniref:Uncharacterized protein n=1 Tax=Sphaerimonospora thailandensis TaxID=795644 RepID=A0A8J3R6W3_9ACTN|nr:hypothetical protein [Sphaerimonospora thailandensis]GIH69460.1 hypothetical protein Mth01_17130 [Sphaerimonospora thailandensis]